MAKSPNIRFDGLAATTSYPLTPEGEAVLLDILRTIRLLEALGRVLRALETKRRG